MSYAAHVEELRAKRARMCDELEQLSHRHIDSGVQSDGMKDRMDNVQRGIAKIDEELVRLANEERQRIADGVSSGSLRVEAGVDLSNGVGDDTVTDVRARQSQSAALRTIERYGDVLRSDAADTLDDLVRRRDPTGIDSRYLAAVGDPAYNNAFGKMLADPNHGHLRFTPQEVEAVRRVPAVMLERGMVEGTGSAGGFGIPFSLDSSILAVSNGALNPIRQVASVITIGTREWKGVSSQGVVASYDPEASEVSDDTPVLAQPNIVTAMGRAWVPFSIELSQDWASLQQELTQLIADARDVLDSTMFYSGTGTDQPAGVRTGLTTTQRVLTDVAATLDIDDVWDIKGQLPARFMPNATFALHPSKADAVFRFTPSGSTTEPQAMPTRDGLLCGRPKVEWTAIPTVLTTGTTQLLYGDFRAGFRIPDRLGMTAELVNLTLGANRRPDGGRGLFCYWRSGSKTVVPEALRYLETL